MYTLYFCGQYSSIQLIFKASSFIRCTVGLPQVYQHTYRTYRRNVFKYRDMIFLSYRPPLRCFGYMSYTFRRKMLHVCIKLKLMAISYPGRLRDVLHAPLWYHHHEPLALCLHSGLSSETRRYGTQCEAGRHKFPRGLLPRLGSKEKQAQ